jgi:hypothetical protein
LECGDLSPLSHFGVRRFIAAFSFWSATIHRRLLTGSQAASTGRFPRESLVLLAAVAAVRRFEKRR